MIIEIFVFEISLFLNVLFYKSYFVGYMQNCPASAIVTCGYRGFLYRLWRTAVSVFLSTSIMIVQFTVLWECDPHHF